MNEEEKAKLLKTGKIMTIVGLILFVTGLVCFITGPLLIFVSDDFMEGFPPTLIISFVGFPIIPVGFAIFGIGRQKVQIASGRVANRNGQATTFDGNSMTSVSEAEIKKANNGCAHCGYVNEGDAEFCVHCGKSLRCVCSKCGAVNDDDASFCKKCGEHLY